MTRPWKLAFIAAILIVACRQDEQKPKAKTLVRQDQPTHQMKTLSTGKQIELIATEHSELKNSGPTLSLSYVTRTKIADRQKLQEEVEEIWKDFRKEAEAAGVKTAMIWADEDRFPGLSTGFTFKRREDGVWYRSSGFTHKAAAQNAEGSR